MKRMNRWSFFAMAGFLAFGVMARAEMVNQTSVDQPTCCEPCHVTTNCKSPSAPDRVSMATQSTKSGSPGKSYDANQ
jgi:hypothetical protein